MAGQKVGDAYVDIAARFDKLDRQMDQMNRKVKDSFSKTENALSGVFTRLGGVIGGAFAIERIMAFTDEAVRLAGVAEGVRAAFESLDKPGLLDDLKRATRGTVTEVDLMRQAVRAKNFKVPLSQLATFFEFATKRAAQTGESVDYLVNSIIDGIGRKSTLVMDNLGISATELQDEIKKVGDFGLAAGNIIERELGNMGEVAMTSAQSIEAVNTQLKDLQEQIGRELAPTMVKWKMLQIDLLQGSKNMVKNIAELFDFSTWMPLTEESFKKLEMAMGRALTEQERGKILAEGFNASQREMIENYYKIIPATEEQTEEIEKQGKELEKTTKKLKDYSEEWNKYLTSHGAAKGAKGTSSLTPDLTGRGIQSAGLQGVSEAEMNAYIESFTKIGELQVGFQEQQAKIAEGMFILSELGIGFGQALTDGFAMALDGSGDFFEYMQEYLKQLITRLLAAAAAAALLSAFMGGGNFMGLFGQFSGFGGGQSFNGALDFGGVLRGQNIYFSNNRAGRLNNRTTGGN